MLACLRSHEREEEFSRRCRGLKDFGFAR